VSDRFVIIEPRSGARRLDVPLPDPSIDRPLFRRGFVLDDGKGLVVTTSPQSNVTVARTSIQAHDLSTGRVLATFDEAGFATAHQVGGDLLVAVLARGPNEPSAIVAYRMTRE
jgi:hypothetical protein